MNLSHATYPSQQLPLYGTFILAVTHFTKLFSLHLQPVEVDLNSDSVTQFFPCVSHLNIIHRLNKQPSIARPSH